MKEGYVVIQGYILDKDLTPYEMIICGLIDGFMKKYNTCDLNNETIAKLLHISQANVAVHISNLYKKDAITNHGTKKNRKLKLNYHDTPPREKVEAKKADDSDARFEALWEKEPSEKKEAKKEAKKYFKKLSRKKQELVIYARAKYLAERADITYAVLLRTFISKELYEDEKYQTVEKTEEETKQKNEFDSFVHKAMQLVGFVDAYPALLDKSFVDIKKSENDARWFDDREASCLEETVGDMRGLVDQAYDMGNLKALLRTVW